MRMAQLSHGKAAVVTPRLPSLFAPTPAADVTETIETTLQQHDKSEHSAKATQQPALVTANEDQPHTTTHSDSAAQHPIRHQAAVRQKNKRANELKPLIAPWDTDHTARTHVAEPLLSDRQDAPAKKQADSHHSHQTSPLLNDELQARVATTNIDKAVDVVITKHAQQSQVQPQHSLQQLVPGYQYQQAAPQQVMAQLPAAAEHAASQEPVVHINIGRVEVRAQTATPPPARPSVQPKPPSSLSLNDYLKRGGGQA